MKNHSTISKFVYTAITRLSVSSLVNMLIRKNNVGKGFCRDDYNILPYFIYFINLLVILYLLYKSFDFALLSIYYSIDSNFHLLYIY